MKHKNMTYPDSIEYLAKQAGLNPESGIIKDSNYVENNYASLRSIMIEANKFYLSMLNMAMRVFVSTSGIWRTILNMAKFLFRSYHV